jgi:hypothetical protein
MFALRFDRCFAQFRKTGVNRFHRCDDCFGLVRCKAILAGALALAFVTLFQIGAASADVRIVNDPGGEVASFVRKYHAMRAAGEHIVIDGPCLSSCTLLTGIIPRNHVCITRRAVLGFHAASYYDDASRSLVPTQRGSRFVMQLYPQEVRAWINRHGGLTPQLIMMRGPDLAALYPTCQ